MKNIVRAFVAAGLGIVVCAAGLAQDNQPAKKISTGPFSADAYMAHVKFLASDELEGRLPGSEGAQRTAEYMIEKFKAAGCEPGAADGGWLQPFDIRQGKQLSKEKASLKVGSGEQEWKVEEDWVPFPFTEMGHIEGPLAFAGYGIQAKRYEHDDYADFDAEGKVLMVLRYEPRAEDEDAEFGGKTPSRNSLFVVKARKAARAGAQALLIVNPPDRKADSDELYEFEPMSTSQTYDLPMVHISRKLANAILKQAGQPDLAALQKMVDEGKEGTTRDLDLTIAIDQGVEPHKIAASNVIAKLPGDGSTDECIVIGAHRDHLGKVPRQFQRSDMTPLIHNGADDDASGSAGILELARVMAHEPKLRRNLIFIGFDGEEMGLLGSSHYVSEPTVPLEKIRTMVNFDMIGRLKADRYAVFGTHSAKEFAKLVKQIGDKYELEYSTPTGMAGGSDHMPFAWRAIPTLFAFTGMHKDVHQPEDDWEKIDGEGAARVLAMWHDIIRELANMEDGPTYQDPESVAYEDAEEVETPRPAAEEAADYQKKVADEAVGENGDAEPKPTDAKDGRPTDVAPPPSRRDMRVRLGIMPDVAESDQVGVGVMGVREKEPAAIAGIKEGDRIIKIGEYEVRDIHGYMRALQNFEPGDEVDVIVVRDGKEVTTKVKLGKSRGRRPRPGRD